MKPADLDLGESSSATRLYKPTLLVCFAAAGSAWSRNIGDVRSCVNPETAGRDTMAEEAKQAPEKKAPEAKEAAPAAPAAAAPTAKPAEAKKGAGSKGMYHYMGEAWKDQQNPV